LSRPDLLDDQFVLYTTQEGGLWRVVTRATQETYDTIVSTGRFVHQGDREPGTPPAVDDPVESVALLRVETACRVPRKDDSV
jgi:hypothetical protein